MNYLKNPIIQFTLALLLVALVAFSLREFIRTIMIIPLLYTFWVAYIFLSAMPQGLWWGLFIFIALILALRTFPARDRVGAKKPEVVLPTTGQVLDWSRRLNRASQSQYAEWQLARQVGKVSLDILAQRENLTPNQIRQLINQDQITLPDKVRGYLRVGMSNFNPFVEARWHSWVRRLTQIQPVYQGKDEPMTQAISDTEAVLTFLEQTMIYTKETPYDTLITDLDRDLSPTPALTD